MKKITKKQFKNLFIGFSLLLIINYPLLPLLSSLLFNNGGSFCEDYSINICLFITISFVALVAFFWCIAWLINYAIFFMDDHRNQKLKNSFLLPFYLYIKYIQKSFKGSKVKSYSVALVLAIFCFGVIFLFFHELSLILSAKQ